jgi:nitrogen fixation/metabolism regulation signal transduction histidine kinase
VSEEQLAGAGTGELTAIQDFFYEERPSQESQEEEADDQEQDRRNAWKSQGFRGRAGQELKAPPALQQGFVSREMPRDTDIIRYVIIQDRTRLRVLSYNLDQGFDEGRKLVENEKARFEVLDAIKFNIRPVFVFYYGIFFLPTLLMTVIIAISFTTRVTQPLVELTEATRRVAGGDFSIHIMARQNDELSLLIHSFNAMVQELRKSQESLVRAEKISLWQTMAQQLAHEIKNPLTPIRLSAERVLRRWRNEPERAGEILESSMLAIIQETEGLATLLTEFSTLSRPMEPSNTWTEVRSLVEETVAPYRSSYPKLRFNIEHIESGITVKIDGRRLGQVLTNLIINGIDAMSAGGPTADTAGSIEIRGDLVKKQESRYCRLSIQDTGKGIPEEQARQIFTPYFTTKESGTGLGLPIVERIINEHGGAIWFNSAIGAGTTFFVDLPLAALDGTRGKGELKGEA